MYGHVSATNTFHIYCDVAAHSLVSIKSLDPSRINGQVNSVTRELKIYFIYTFYTYVMIVNKFQCTDYYYILYYLFYVHEKSGQITSHPFETPVQKIKQTKHPKPGTVVHLSHHHAFIARSISVSTL